MSSSILDEILKVHKFCIEAFCKFLISCFRKMDGYRRGIGAGSSKKKARSKVLQEQRRQKQGKTEKAKNREQEEMMGAVGMKLI